MTRLSRSGRVYLGVVKCTEETACKAGGSAEANRCSRLCPSDGWATQTVRLWRKHHFDYDQSKHLVEQARRRLELSPPSECQRTVERLDWREVQALIQAAHGLRSTSGLLAKTLFYAGAQVDEVIHMWVDDLDLQDDPPHVHLTHAERQSTR